MVQVDGPSHADRHHSFAEHIFIDLSTYLVAAPSQTSVATPNAFVKNEKEKKKKHYFHYLWHVECNIN